MYIQIVLVIINWLALETMNMKIKTTRRYTVILIILSLSGCAVFPPISEEYILNQTSFDESTIIVDHNNCDYESLIREKFPLYRVHKKFPNEIWFFKFHDKYKSTDAGDFYLLEVFTIDYNETKKINCSQNYFLSFEKRLNRIEKIEIDRNDDGFNKLIDLIKNCDNGK